MVGAADEKLEMLWGKFCQGPRGGQGPDAMPKLLQVHVSWAETRKRPRPRP